MFIQSNAIKLPREFISPPASTQVSMSIPLDKAFFMGVDGGATKTLAMVCNASGTTVATGISGPSNPETLGLAASVSAVTDAITAALASIGGTINDVASAVCSISGVTSTQDIENYKKMIPAFPRAYVNNDVVAAWASGTLCTPGIAIIAGTGSHTIGVNNDGISCRAGGWGHILGDEGAGYYIGLTAIREALRSYDGRMPKTPLLERMLDYFKITSPDDMLRLMYRENLAKDTIAAFAICVSEEAKAGDPVSRSIFYDAGHELGLAASAVAKRLSMQDSEYPVALIGSVFRSKELVLPSLEKTLYVTSPKARLVYPDIPPAAGSVLLAVRAAGAWKYFQQDAFIALASQEY